jgi:integrase
MATCQKRHGRWRVRIQRQGMKAKSFTADTKGECQFWAKRREAELDRLALLSTLPALPAPLPIVVSARPWTVRELVEHYRSVVLPQQKAGKPNGYHLDAMLRTADFADRSCYDIRRRDAVRWFDLRLGQVSPAAAVKELNLWHRVYEVGNDKEWDQFALETPNPFDKIQRPKNYDRQRNRTIRNEDELKRLLAACAEYGRRRRKPDLAGASLFHAVSFARLSALRRSELIGFRLKDIDFDESAPTIHFRDTKSDVEQWRPLTEEAVAFLKDWIDQRKLTDPEAIVFPFASASS